MASRLPPSLLRSFSRPSVARAGALRLRASLAPYSTEAGSPPLLSQLKADLKTAMKNKDTNRLAVLRSVLAATVNASKTESPITTDAHLIALLKKTAKKSRDAAAQARQAGRVDLAEKEEEQQRILEEYAANYLSAPAEKEEQQRVPQEDARNSTSAPTENEEQQHVPQEDAGNSINASSEESDRQQWVPLVDAVKRRVGTRRPPKEQLSRFSIEETEKAVEEQLARLASQGVPDHQMRSRLVTTVLNSRHPVFANKLIAVVHAMRATRLRRPGDNSAESIGYAINTLKKGTTAFADAQTAIQSITWAFGLVKRDIMRDPLDEATREKVVMALVDTEAALVNLSGALRGLPGPVGNAIRTLRHARAELQATAEEPAKAEAAGGEVIEGGATVDTAADESPKGQ